MNKKTLIQILRQLLTVIIVFSLIFQVNLSAKKKRGANLLVTTLAGETISGELLRVNVNERTLLLMTSASKTGAYININDVYQIRKRKKSKLWAGPLVAISIGLIGGIAAVEATGKKEEFKVGFMFYGQFIGIPIGTLVLLASLRPRGYKEIMVDGKSEFKIKRILIKLKSKARFKD